MRSHCPECVRPCPEHNITFCKTCHTHPGECSYGGCERSNKNGTTFEFRTEEGRVYERRRFCRKHSTHPNYGWVRRGGVPVGVS